MSDLHKDGTIDSVHVYDEDGNDVLNGGLAQLIESLKTKRVWWKPWTWRRRRTFTYMPMQEVSGASAWAVNPAAALSEGDDERNQPKLFFEEDDFEFDDNSDVFFVFE